MEQYRPAITRAAIGSRDVAEAVARRTVREVKAYRSFLDRQGVPHDAAFDGLPVQDKSNYVKKYPFRDLLGADFSQTFTIFSSAGSAGQAFYWPQLKTSYRGSAEQLRTLLERLFGIQQKRTMAIIGLALGSWIGGDVLSWSLKDVAAGSDYPFVVFSPGSKHDEIIAMLKAASGMVDQFLLICCPSAIGHLILQAEQMGQPLPFGKMRYLVIGESFPELLRSDLESRAGSRPDETVMVSVYGSADTGVLGFESPASITLRKLCVAEPAIAEALGIKGVTPHFFHQADGQTYLEVIGSELCVSKWQGIPLVRYNLHDRAMLFEWIELVSSLQRLQSDSQGLAAIIPGLKSMTALLPHTGLLAIAGRAGACLILCGTKLSEAMLDEAVRSPELAGTLTGAYQAKVIVNEGRQQLEMTLECRTEGDVAEAVIDRIYPKLIMTIGRAQPEFLDDWSNIYSRWDGDPLRRILKLDLVPWPRLTEARQGNIKQHSIIL